jgi:hypothetical protein
MTIYLTCEECDAPVAVQDATEFGLDAWLCPECEERRRDRLLSEPHLARWIGSAEKQS